MMSVMPLLMIIAGIVYALMISLIPARSEQGSTLIEDIFLGITIDLILAFAIALFFDYRGIQSRLPGTHSISKIRNYFIMLLYCVLFMILVCLLYSIV